MSPSSHRQSDGTEPLLTTGEAAARLHVTPDHVVDLIHANRLRAVNVSFGKRPTWRIDPADLEAFIVGRTVTPRPAPAKRRKRTAETVTCYF